jgi:hypothetical protein
MLFESFYIIRLQEYIYGNIAKMTKFPAKSKEIDKSSYWSVHPKTVLYTNHIFFKKKAFP